MNLRFRNLPLFYKLLVPFAALVLIVGAFGAYLITHDLASRARSALNQDLLQSSLEARALLQQRELSLLDSANIAANLQGMATAVSRGDAPAVTRLLRTVVALKTDLDLIAVGTRNGVGLVEFTRHGSESALRPGAGTRWNSTSFVRAAMTDAGGSKQAGLITASDQRALAIASPVCSAVSPCGSVGFAIVGVRVDRLVTAVVRGEAAGHDRRAGLALYDDRGSLLSAVGLIATNRAVPEPQGRDLIRTSSVVSGTRIDTLYAPFIVKGERAGVIAVSLPTDPVFASVKSAGLRLTFVLLAALLGIAALGALLSRVIMRQVRPLVATNRALGLGDLAARAPVVSGDEIGEVARGLNQMAEQLQASRETLELRVAQRTEEVQRLLKERTEFFASLSHELRTPLAVILNESDYLLDAGRGRTINSARAIKLSGAQLLAVVNDILDLAKAEVGRLEIDPVPVQLADVTDELAPTMVGLTRAAELTLTIDVPADLPAISADPLRLKEIIINLVDNAAKYTPAGGHVELSAVREGNLVRVNIRDTGPGIPEEIGDRIFEPFFRVKGIKARSARGSSGLGLALTRRLVESHGGTIGFESRPGAGTTLSFALPVSGKPIGRPKQRSTTSRP